MLVLLSHKAWSAGRHLAAALLLWLLCAQAAHSQLILNGKPAFSDSLSNILLYPIPQESFGNDFTAVVQVDTASQWHNISVNGQPLANNPITFADVDGSKSYIIRAIVNRKPIVKRLQFTFLPIMRIDGNVGYDYTLGQVTLLSPTAHSPPTCWHS